MRWSMAVLLSVLTACSSPSPQFLGSPASRQTVDGWRIDVYRNGNRAQAIRLSAAFGAHAYAMQLRGAEAIYRATGCTVDPDKVRADSSVMTATLRCDAD